tara:strand:- start:504 stop:1208 length:705 start_codon:yes stop_codon:yes gene_type:complete
MNWKEKAKEYSEKLYPKEACGLVAIIKGKKVFYPCKNVAESTMEFFALDPDDYADCENQGEIIGIFHSHPVSSSIPSEVDILSCNYLKMLWYIYSNKDDSWNEITPKENLTNPLIGRKFVWGVQDCWSLIYDWYLLNKNITLKKWTRPKSLKEFENNPLFEKCSKDTGFKEVTNQELKIGDVMLMEGMYNKLSHVALYIGDSTILHHTVGKLSCREIYDLEYQKITKKIYRYET